MSSGCRQKWARLKLAKCSCPSGAGRSGPGWTWQSAPRRVLWVQAEVGQAELGKVLRVLRVQAELGQTELGKVLTSIGSGRSGPGCTWQTNWRELGRRFQRFYYEKMLVGPPDGRPLAHISVQVLHVLRQPSAPPSIHHLFGALIVRATFYYSLTYLLFSTYSFIFYISAIQVEKIDSVCGEVLYISVQYF